jgi:hypothetical protein
VLYWKAEAKDHLYELAVGFPLALVPLAVIVSTLPSFDTCAPSRIDKLVRLFVRHAPAD